LRSLWENHYGTNDTESFLPEVRPVVPAPNPDQGGGRNAGKGLTRPGFHAALARGLRALTEGRAIRRGGYGHRPLDARNGGAIRSSALDDEALRAIGLAAFGAAPQALIVLGPDEHPLAVNAAFEKLFGLTLDTLTEIGWRGILGGASRDVPLDRLAAKPLWGGAPHILRNAQGRTFQARLWVAPPDGDESLRVVGIQDVSLEVTARQERDSLRAALDALPLAILFLDAADDVLRVNPFAETFLGQQSDHLKGLPLSFLLVPEKGASAADGSGRGRLVHGALSRSVYVQELCCSVDGPVARVLAIREAADPPPLARPEPEPVTDDGARRRRLAHQLRQPIHGIRLQAEAISEGLGSQSARDRALRIAQEVDRLESHLQAMEAGLPPEEPARRATAEEAEAASPGTARILVVDDEALSLMVVEQYLVRLGHAVDLAFDGAEALALLAENSYDLVITDLSMPDVRGEDVARHLARRTPRTAVIVVSGRSEAPPLDNVAAFIPKPFALTTLRDAVSRVLVGRQGEAA